jgi:phosphoribosylglycinamide formyltransferase 1
VEVLEEDTPESLQRRVMVEAEWELLPKAINLIANRQVVYKDGKVRILSQY